jgi:hypothetical protein
LTDGRFIVADVKIRLPCPPECGRIVVGPTGFVLFSPLPDDRWLIFVNRNETDVRPELPIVDELGALLKIALSWQPPLATAAAKLYRPSRRSRAGR